MWGTGKQGSRKPPSIFVTLVTFITSVKKAACQWEMLQLCKKLKPKEISKFWSFKTLIAPHFWSKVFNYFMNPSFGSRCNFYSLYLAASEVHMILLGAYSSTSCQVFHMKQEYCEIYCSSASSENVNIEFRRLEMEKKIKSWRYFHCCCSQDSPEL